MMLLSSYGQTSCWCQKCCIWCQCHQMHWRLNVMSELLHPTVKRSDARWRLSVNEIVRAAFDIDVIRCTGGCLDVRIAAPGLKTIKWKTIDAQVSAPDRDKIKCTDRIVWLSDCCTRPWNNQMHADGCLLTRIKRSWLCVENVMSGLLHSIVIQSDARWRLFVAKIRCSQLIETLFAMKCRDFAPDAEIVECIDDCLNFRRIEAQRLFVDANETFDICWCCRLIDWLQNKLLTDEWRRLDVKCSLSLIANNFFRSQAIFFFVFSDVFRVVNAVFRWFDCFLCKAKWIWLVCGDTSIFDRSSDFPNECFIKKQQFGCFIATNVIAWFTRNALINVDSLRRDEIIYYSEHETFIWCSCSGTIWWWLDFMKVLANNLLCARFCKSHDRD